MDDAGGLSYKPPPDFEEDKRDTLIELKLTDSTELWLLQWPLNHAPDFDGLEVSLELHHDGILGSFESSSGKPYDVYSRKAQDPELTVFSSSSSSSSDANIVGTFSRHVSFIHYPDPSEYEKANQIRLKEISQRSSSYTSTKTGSTFHRSSATKSSRQRTSSPSPSVFTASPAPSSRHKKSSPKEKSGGESAKNKTVGPSLLLPPEDSRRATSTVTTSGSAGQHSQERTSKKPRKS
ncbi:unnamed protein product [Cuscuta campestris]|uniref:Mediator-associated protein 2 n=1 Tax=Cuscuta campestris TaxID=132261 RepID=A0A484M6N8_9ASTE|nr:unnamed protein product [Cuscuta campestris]